MKKVYTSLEIYEKVGRKLPFKARWNCPGHPEDQEIFTFLKEYTKGPPGTAFSIEIKQNKDPLISDVKNGIGWTLISKKKKTKAKVPKKRPIEEVFQEIMKASGITIIKKEQEKPLIERVREEVFGKA